MLSRRNPFGSFSAATMRHSEGAAAGLCITAVLSAPEITETNMIIWVRTTTIAMCYARQSEHPVKNCNDLSDFPAAAQSRFDHRQGPKAVDMSKRTVTELGAFADIADWLFPLRELFH
jgi:hypothetical protein